MTPAYQHVALSRGREGSQAAEDVPGLTNVAHDVATVQRCVGVGALGSAQVADGVVRLDVGHDVCSEGVSVCYFGVCACMCFCALGVVWWLVG